MSNREDFYIWLDLPEEEQNTWIQLDNVIRKWASLSLFQKDQSDYQRMKEFYQ